VHFDVWFSEQALFATGLVARCVEASRGSRPSLRCRTAPKWFKSTAFGDEKDRVVQRDNGLYTYFASDIAYHLNKYERGFERIINIWGADHHGYIPRVKGALSALGLDSGRARRGAGAVRRALPQRAESVDVHPFGRLRHPAHAARRRRQRRLSLLLRVLRKSDQHLDFDLDLAKSQTNDNPVYYIQYAHARLCSLLAQWGGDAGDPATRPISARLDQPVRTRRRRQA
jgi:arginyl-tRNA synthetase